MSVEPKPCLKACIASAMAIRHANSTLFLPLRAIYGNVAELRVRSSAASAPPMWMVHLIVRPSLGIAPTPTPPALPELATLLALLATRSLWPPHQPRIARAPRVRPRISRAPTTAPTPMLGPTAHPRGTAARYSRRCGHAGTAWPGPAGADSFKSPMHVNLYPLGCLGYSWTNGAGHIVRIY